MDLGGGAEVGPGAECRQPKPQPQPNLNHGSKVMVMASITRLRFYGILHLRSGIPDAKDLMVKL